MTEHALSVDSHGGLDEYQLAARLLRERMRDKSYRAYEIGQEAGSYLRWKRGRITDSTYRDYESCLDKLARAFPDLCMADFEPPVGTERLEEFLDKQWGDSAPRTYNKNLSVVKDFFKWAVLKGKLHGDPSLPLVPHKKRDVHREIFRDDDRSRIIASGPEDSNLRRDRIALRLLLTYGLRKGALQSIQFKHFDANRRALTIFTKGEKVRELKLVNPALWDDLAKLQFDLSAEPGHYLMAREKTIWNGYEPDGSSRFIRKRYPDKPKGAHGMHDWWYACLQRAGIVAKGTTRGEKMHKARHTAGQRLLDKHHDLKAVQKLLGHSDISTTGNTYVDHDMEAVGRLMEDLDD